MTYNADHLMPFVALKTNENQMEKISWENQHNVRRITLKLKPKNMKKKTNKKTHTKTTKQSKEKEIKEKN